MGQKIWQPACSFCTGGPGPLLAGQNDQLDQLGPPGAYLWTGVPQSQCAGCAKLGLRLPWQLAAAPRGSETAYELQQGRRLGGGALCERIAQLQGALLQHHRHIAASGVLVVHVEEDMWGGGLWGVRKSPARGCRSPESQGEAWLGEDTMSGRDQNEWTNGRGNKRGRMEGSSKKWDGDRSTTICELESADKSAGETAAGEHCQDENPRAGAYDGRAATCPASCRLLLWSPSLAAAAAAGRRALPECSLVLHQTPVLYQTVRCNHGKHTCTS